MKLDSKLPFAKLIYAAYKENLFDESTVDRLHAGRKLRNTFSHPDQQTVFTFAIAANSIEASHELIVALFPAPSEHGARG